MSLVTTAIRSCPDSRRHRAATSAVLPEPTGPPIPTRNARVPAPPLDGRKLPPPGECESFTPGGFGSPPGRYGSWCSRCKETHLPAGVNLGADVEQGSRGGGQFVDRPGAAGGGGAGDSFALRGQ